MFLKEDNYQFTVTQPQPHQSVNNYQFLTPQTEQLFQYEDVSQIHNIVMIPNPTMPQIDQPPTNDALNRPRIAALSFDKLQVGYLLLRFFPLTIRIIT